MMTLSALCSLQFSRLFSTKGALLGVVLVLAQISHAKADEFVLPDPIVMRLVPQKALKALDQIPDTGRRLLALRAYVRSHGKIDQRWSWTEEEIKAFQGSEKQKALLAEVKAIADHFAKHNAGFQIYANTKVRSLDVQLANWNRNESVGIAGAEILNAWKKQFGTGGRFKGGKNGEQARKWLFVFFNKTRPRVAAPGLTLHGRASAIDFQVMKDGKIIAGAQSRLIKSAWRESGWDKKLEASILAAGPSFKGPLKSPDEPWHYDYLPEPQ